MDLSYGKDYEAFRAEARAFLKNHADKHPSQNRYDGFTKSSRAWQKTLIAHGYAARTIPKDYGGFGAEPDILKSRIIAEEFVKAGAPMGFQNQGISMLVPTLLELGTEEQKKRYIPPTIKGEMVWCQGYSEPNAGSDLAGLQTRGVEDGDDFVINGQKIWTSTAQIADMMFCLVRTEPDAPKHAGISYILIPMTTPGLDVRPLTTMTGRPEFNEVFFTDVRVPKKNLVGRRGEGWFVANATLKHERGMLGNPNISENRLAGVVRLMEEETEDGARVMDNPVFRDRLAALQGRVMAMRYHGMRLLTHSIKGTDPGVAGMIVKLQGCELNHQLAALAIDVMGEMGVLYEDSPHIRADGSWQWSFMYDLGLIIGGGTAQIQKNIIAERGLGLPRGDKEPAPVRAAAR